MDEETFKKIVNEVVEALIAKALPNIVDEALAMTASIASASFTIFLKFLRPYFHYFV